MLPDTTRPPRWTMFLAVLTGLGVASAIWLAIPSTRVPSDPGWTQTPTGPVGPADRAMLIALRQAALWEAALGQQSQQMAVEPAVRQLGGTLATDVGWLSGQVRALAAQLGVVLPSQPNPDQEAWLTAIASTSGSGYDRLMINRLRQGCAETLNAVTLAQSATRNSQIRELADRAAALVGQHLDALDRLHPTP